ncbi:MULTISPECIES: GntR family transcriptional regulator [Eubacteriales]|uniref:GntR family transcriptional regulator n=1 Tax=Eubacteriales TaxID=186802 RepID=UPI000B38731E|nr:MULTISPECIES: GntR family transcriptional regulator [Eubacteriales]MDY4167013.1 GntR family transcriptional regulator [Fournierella sp.]OUP24734.1 GntR family transcriptional regulator [Gemmiger sp. An194]
MSVPPNTKEIYQILESEIVSLKIAPGEVLTENSLCERFQVSRTPIRSVLQRLQENKFVEIIPHKSTTVTRINLDIATQLIYERVAIESMVFRDFVRTASPTAVEQVRDLLHRMETLAEASHHLEEFDSYAFLAADHDMHEFWFLFCGKDMLWKRIIRPHPDYSRLMRMDVTGAKNVPDVLHDHQLMMQMIDDHSEAGIEELMVRHMYGNVRRLGSKLFSGEYKKYLQPVPNE